MANVDAGPEQQRNVTRAPDASSAPARAYEECAELLYSVVRFFLPEDAACETLEAIAAALLAELPRSGYTRYSKLLCLKLACGTLSANTSAKPPKSLAAASQDSLAEATFNEALCLLLRDRFSLTPFEIAAAVGASEGSIRTRLERARARLFPTTFSPKPPAGLLAQSTANHVCLRAREAVEDWDIVNPRLGQFTVPATVARVTGDCARCGQLLQQRLSSLGYFHEYPSPVMPEKLKTFPVSPMFVKEGRRLLLNWSAAPWYAKALFEGLLATTLVLGIVLSIPRIKSIYEFWLERRLDLYSIAELAAGLGKSDTSTEPAATPTPATTAAPAAGFNGTTGPNAAQAESSTTSGETTKTAAPNERLALKTENEFIGRDAEIPSSEKIYRVLIKTDSPETIKDQVVRLLGTVHYTAADADSTLGAELPGGVMFDVFVPLKSYKQTVNELAKMGETKFIITRAKERGAPGKAHLKIWLQRI